jgi:hypothetical protein
MDPEIQTDIDRIKDYVDGINFLMKSLYEKGVEIKISYKDNTNNGSGTIPHLELWRAIEHIDYLKKD